MKSFILIALFSLVSCNVASSPVATDSILVDSKFDTALEAVIAASNAHNPRSIKEDREAIGVVINQDGVFKYSIGYGDEGQSTVHMKFTIPDNSYIVAFWHTHGSAGVARTMFSKIDADLANSSDLPVYMAAPDGFLRVFKPNDKRLLKEHVIALGIGHENTGAALGTVVINKITGYPIEIKVE